MNRTQILTLTEIQAVVLELRRRATRSLNSHQNLALFRLSCCCGLRRKEIQGLLIKHVETDGARPCVYVPAEITKGQIEKRRRRWVPLWWDRGTFEDLLEWKKIRIQQAAGDTTQPFICATRAGNQRRPIALCSVAARWGAAIRSALGKERAAQLSIHSGRHTFCTVALASGRSLVEVRDAAGHANVSMTSQYLHLVEREGIPDLFALPEPPKKGGAEC